MIDWTSAQGLLLAVVPVVTLGGLTVGWGQFKERFNSHEAMDAERFRMIEVLVKEVRDDVKKILQEGGE